MVAKALNTSGRSRTNFCADDTSSTDSCSSSDELVPLGDGVQPRRLNTFARARSRINFESSPCTSLSSDETTSTSLSSTDFGPIKVIDPFAEDHKPVSAFQADTRQYLIDRISALNTVANSLRDEHHTPISLPEMALKTKDHLGGNQDESGKIFKTVPYFTFPALPSCDIPEGAIRFTEEETIPQDSGTEPTKRIDVWSSRTMVPSRATLSKVEALSAPQYETMPSLFEGVAVKRVKKQRAAHVTASCYTCYKSGIMKMDTALHLALDNHDDYNLTYVPTYKNGTPIMKKKHLRFLENLQTGENLHESGTLETCFETATLLHHLNITQLHQTAFAISVLQDKGLISEGGDNREVAQFVRSCRNAFCLKLVDFLIRESGGYEPGEDHSMAEPWAIAMAQEDKRFRINIGEQLVMRIGSYQLAVDDDAFFQRQGGTHSHSDKWNFELDRDTGLWFCVPLQNIEPKLLFFNLDSLQLDELRPMTDVYEVKAFNLSDAGSRTPKTWDIFKLDAQSDIRDIIPADSKKEGQSLALKIQARRAQVEMGTCHPFLKQHATSSVKLTKPVIRVKGNLSSLIMKRKEADALKRFENHTSSIMSEHTIEEEVAPVLTETINGTYVRPHGLASQIKRPGRSRRFRSYATRYESPRFKGPTIGDIPRVSRSETHSVYDEDDYGPDLQYGWNLGNGLCVELRDWMIAQNHTVDLEVAPLHHPLPDCSYLPPHCGDDGVFHHPYDYRLKNAVKRNQFHSFPYLINKPQGPCGKSITKVIVPKVATSMAEIERKLQREQRKDEKAKAKLRRGKAVYKKEVAWIRGNDQYSSSASITSTTSSSHRCPHESFSSSSSITATNTNQETGLSRNTTSGTTLTANRNRFPPIHHKPDCPRRWPPPEHFTRLSLESSSFGPGKNTSLPGQGPRDSWDKGPSEQDTTPSPKTIKPRAPGSKYVVTSKFGKRKRNKHSKSRSEETVVDTHDVTTSRRQSHTKSPRGDSNSKTVSHKDLSFSGAENTLSSDYHYFYGSSGSSVGIIPDMHSDMEHHVAQSASLTCRSSSLSESEPTTSSPIQILTFRREVPPQSWLYPHLDEDTYTQDVESTSLLCTSVQSSENAKTTILLNSESATLSLPRSQSTFIRSNQPMTASSTSIISSLPTINHSSQQSSPNRRKQRRHVSKETKIGTTPPTEPLVCTERLPSRIPRVIKYFRSQAQYTEVVHIR